jgi:hypothetical protein
MSRSKGLVVLQGLTGTTQWIPHHVGRPGTHSRVCHRQLAIGTSPLELLLIHNEAHVSPAM